MGRGHGPPRTKQVCELSWEPTERWIQLPRGERRTQRGAKSTAHLANLRRSDPLINAWAWRDSSAELRRVESSPLARLNQQARIMRGLAEHRMLTRLLLERLERKEERYEGKEGVARLKAERQEELQEEEGIERKAAACGRSSSARPGLHERASNDSVLDLDLELGLSMPIGWGVDNLDNLDNLEPVDLGWGDCAARGGKMMQFEAGDYSPKSVVPSEPCAQGTSLEADGSFGYHLASQ